MRKALSLIILLVCMFVHAIANDGVYFTSGNFLVPVSETDILVTKEILTITIGKDSFATVDVYYEFDNPKQSKTVTMAFEATPPYNAWIQVNKNGEHPFIKDFTVMMNGDVIDYSNALVAKPLGGDDPGGDFTPLDLSQWKGYGEVPDSLLPMEDVLFNENLDSLISYSYAYYFKAPFKHGLNIVHHTYRYRMSFNVMERFNIPYLLTPATRWANAGVDDFTLRIKADDYTEFCLADSLFRQSEFISSKGKKVYHLKPDNGDKVLFARIDPDETIEWHTSNFRPAENMNIMSPSWDANEQYRWGAISAKVVETADGHVLRFIGETDDSYFISAQDYGFIPKEGCRLTEYKAENGQGCVVPETDTGSVSVWQQPSATSNIIGKIDIAEDELPETFDCLGLVREDWARWFIINFNGRKGYVRFEQMVWDAVNSY